MPKTPRKSISVSVRFEVFKRDKFTCQYCGCKAPDVVLHLEHIVPVSKGGTSDIINLVTACVSCNLGKGARLLDDHSTVQKQRAQIEEMAARREQLEMLVRWRDHLQAERDDILDIIACQIDSKSNFALTGAGRDTVRKWIPKYRVGEILDAIDAAFDRYLERDRKNPEKFTSGSWEVAFRKVPAIIAVQRQDIEKPYLKELFYIRGILRNRLRNVDEKAVLARMEDAVSLGASIESLKEVAKSVSTYPDFIASLNKYIQSKTK